MEIITKQKGITLPELAITASIFAMMGIGLMALFVEFNRQYKISAIETQLEQYATLALDELEKDLQLAEDSYLYAGRNNISHIDLYIPMKPASTVLSEISYTAHPQRGVLVNGNPLPRNRRTGTSGPQGAFRFPNYGEFFKGEDYQVRVESFLILPWRSDIPDIQFQRDVIYNIELKLSLQFENSGEDVRRYYSYTRKVFLDRKYI